MAITAATSLSGFAGFLNRNQAQPFFDLAAKQSVMQTLARKVPLGINGEAIPVITSKMQASWVNEAGQKPASQGTLGLKTMDPKKIAAIAVVSAEVVRANPGSYMDMIRPQIAEAFALAFDAAVFHGTSTPFGQYLDQTTKAVELGGTAQGSGGVWGDLVTALDLLVTDNKRMNGFALDSVVEPNMLGATDTTGRPLFVETTQPSESIINPEQLVRTGRLMGRPFAMSDTVATTNKTTVVGYAGDFTQCVWGAVGGISYDVSTQATVTINGTLTSLWENNLVAVRAEAEFGFLCNDVQAFVRLANLTGS